MSAIKERKKQKLVDSTRIQVQFERKYIEMIKVLAKKENKSISKFIADSVITLNNLNLNESEDD